MSKPTSQSHKSGHRYALQRLSSYMDGQLSDREQARVQAHLNACPDCSEQLRTLRWTRDLAREMPVLPVPRSFIVREADLEPAPRAQLLPRFSRSLASLQAAAAIVAVLLVLVVAGDVFVGNGSPFGNFGRSGAAPESAKLPATETISADAPAGTKQLPDNRTTLEEPVQDPKPQILAAKAEVTLTITNPAPGLSPTWTTRSPGTHPPPEFPAEETLTKHSTTTQLTLTVTTVPTYTAPAEPASIPESLPTKELTQTAPLPPDPEQTRLAKRSELPTEEQTRSGQGGQKDLDAQLTTKAGPKLGWKVVQAGLGMILAGLLIAIIWLRLKARAG
jgi:hypothetical protein